MDNNEKTAQGAIRSVTTLLLMALALWSAYEARTSLAMATTGQLPQVGGIIFMLLWLLLMAFSVACAMASIDDKRGGNDDVETD